MTFLEPFVNEMKNLYNNGLVLRLRHEERRIRVAAITGSLDLPAKSEFLNMIGHNGAHGCKDCLIEGAHVVNKKGYSHYYSFEATKNAEDRTDEDSISNAREAIEKNKTVNGIKGATFFMALPIFSIRDGIVVDYMHGILLGVGKTLLNLWFEVGDHKNYYKAHKTYPAYFVGHDIDDVDERLLKMQPPDFISRRPRKIDGNIGHLKANELRSWILYYALPCLKDILPETCWNHFSLLVEGLHIILSDSVSRDDITNARKYFRTF
ncbi:uncharacterized protein [Clytia hemisphaerica]|uniref:uncharacterized protein n=1 Tax=Clytia hemisphaerica TaxID=252671 RepID=UPI0034D6E168